MANFSGGVYQQRVDRQRNAQTHQTIFHEFSEPFRWKEAGISRAEMKKKQLMKKAWSTAVNIERMKGTMPVVGCDVM
jgi:hypothetical protein